ncbi:MAG: hypothetical protein HY544_03885 [Candidatus Diapherotrites archaeon]|uniref:Peptide chain release factor 1 n=1 Tax=Candidatus Iainarchaeum sp. TaxID=3101447 RepID=A0A8T3YNM8_9ARCH|nr:hypothetical protein [Candidatus Diapherotrites archaeon]
MAIAVDTSASEEVIFKKKLKKLEQYKGRGTELISVYIPPGTDRSAVMGQLSEEVSQSGNIKSPQTRKNVQGALRKIINFLKQIDFGIPANGLVVFAGNISETEGRADLRLFTIRPIKELRTKRYWCDSEFHLEPLKEMARPSNAYGLITIDKSEATIAILVGKRYEILGHFTSGYSGKMRAGGQCIAPGTSVMLSDGRELKAESIDVNGALKSADLAQMKIADTAINAKWEKRKKEWLSITTKNPERKLDCSREHAIFAWESGRIHEKEASKLNAGEFLVAYDRNMDRFVPAEISRIKANTGQTRMIDFSTASRNFIANGLVVHNSAQRFERLREEAEQEFYKRISGKSNAAFLPYGEKLQGLIVGGPGMTKQFFLEKDMLDHRLKGKVLATLDTSYTDESGIRELMQKSETVLKDTDLMKERAAMNDFFTRLAKDGLATYGEKEVFKALEMGQAEKVLVSEGIDWVVYKVQNVSNGEVKTIVDKDNTFSETGFRGEHVEVIEEEEYIDYMMEKASQTSAKVEVVSIETPEGEQFYKGFGGLGAILRYRL